MDENKTLDPKLQEALKGVWGSLTAEQKKKAAELDAALRCALLHRRCGSF